MNEPFDLIVRNAHVATAADLFHCDIGVRDGRIAALADHLPAATGTSEIDAAGRFVTPGGVDSHCHLDQPMQPPSVWQTTSSPEHDRPPVAAPPR